MPRERPFEKIINEFYKVHAMDSVLFGYYLAQKESDQCQSDRDIVIRFAAIFDLSEDEFPLESAMVMLHRVKYLFKYKIAIR